MPTEWGRFLCRLKFIYRLGEENCIPTVNLYADREIVYRPEFVCRPGVCMPTRILYRLEISISTGWGKFIYRLYADREIVYRPEFVCRPRVCMPTRILYADWKLLYRLGEENLCTDCMPTGGGRSNAPTSCQHLYAILVRRMIYRLRAELAGKYVCRLNAEICTPPEWTPPWCRLHGS